MGISMGVIAVTQISCEPVLQSSTEHWGMQFAAVHGYCVPAHMYGQQVSFGVIAVTQTSCEPVVQSSTEQ